MQSRIRIASLNNLVWPEVIRSLILILCAVFPAAPSLADTRMAVQPSERFIIANLSGEISDRDVRALELIIKQKDRSQRLNLWVNSAGGQWYAAIKIGHLLRAADALVTVNGDCLSACVMILAGATRRLVLAGRVGVHRPFSPDTGALSRLQAESRYKSLERATQLYLSQMNIPPSLFDAMVSVPPEEIKILTEIELAAFRLSQNDPVTQDLDNAEEARNYKIPMREYLARKGRQDHACLISAIGRSGPNDRVGIDDWVRCREAVMRGTR